MSHAPAVRRLAAGLAAASSLALGASAPAIGSGVRAPAPAAADDMAGHRAAGGAETKGRRTTKGRKHVRSTSRHRSPVLVKGRKNT